jgi:hypothetical protein
MILLNEFPSRIITLTTCVTSHSKKESSSKNYNMENDIQKGIGGFKYWV